MKNNLFLNEKKTNQREKQSIFLFPFVKSAILSLAIVTYTQAQAQQVTIHGSGITRIINPTTETVLPFTYSGAINDNGWLLPADELDSITFHAIPDTMSEQIRIDLTTQQVKAVSSTACFIRRQGDTYSITLDQNKQPVNVRITGCAQGPSIKVIGTGQVHIILDNASMTTYNTPAIISETTGTTTIEMVGSNSITTEGTPQDAAISTKNRLVLKGDGQLRITGTGTQGIAASHLDLLTRAQLMTDACCVNAANTIRIDSADVYLSSMAYEALSAKELTVKHSSLVATASQNAQAFKTEKMVIGDDTKLAAIAGIHTFPDKEGTTPMVILSDSLYRGETICMRHGTGNIAFQTERVYPYRYCLMIAGPQKMNSGCRLYKGSKVTGEDFFGLYDNGTTEKLGTQLGTIERVQVPYATLHVVYERQEQGGQTIDVPVADDNPTLGDPSQAKTRNEKVK